MVQLRLLNIFARAKELLSNDILDVHIVLLIPSSGVRLYRLLNGMMM